MVPWVGSCLLLSRILLRRRTMATKLALIDLSGTLHIDEEATPNAISALKKLRQTNIQIKFVTNTTKESSRTLHERLCRIGFDLSREEIYSSLCSASEYVKINELNPFYLVSSDARTEFPPEDNTKSLDSVVIGLAPTEFQYENMNKAFNILMNNKEHSLIAIHQGKYFKRKDGLALGPGCFVKGLEYATGTQPILIGKPNKYFFENAVPKDIDFEECVMIGDDANDDIKGAMSVGMKGILVKTGKYLPHVLIEPLPTATVENFSEAVELIIHNKL